MDLILQGYRMQFILLKMQVMDKMKKAAKRIGILMQLYSNRLHVLFQK